LKKISQLQFKIKKHDLSLCSNLSRTLEKMFDGTLNCKTNKPTNKQTNRDLNQ